MFWSMNASSDALPRKLAVLELRLDVVAVQEGDEIDADLLGARRFALAVVGAAAEQLLHRVDHGGDALVPLRLPLREHAEVRCLGRREQLRRTVRARGD